MKLILVLVLAFVCVTAKKLEEKFKWKEISYAWPSEEIKQEAIKSGKYIEAHNLPLGLDVWGDKLFVTVPRWKGGVASSLNYINLNDGVEPKFHPYPSWEANELPSVANDAGDSNYGGGRTDAKAAEKVDNVLEKNNSTIISTFRIRVDECDRLWVIDTGLADILGSPKQWAPNSIAIFDLKDNDRLIHRYIIPEDQVKEDSFFANIIVDTQTSNCGNAFAYLPDLGSYAVIVYDFKNDRSYRVKHNFFHFDPLQGDLTVGGVNFQWTDGVFGMALGKASENGERKVYFHALASTKEFYVSNKILNNETLATSGDSYFEYKLLGDRGNKSQSTAEFFDDHTDTIFYTQINRDAIGCWNINKPYTAENQGLVDSDSDALVFPNDLKIDRNGNLYVLSDRMPLFIYSNLKDDFNYRILTGKTSEIIEGTPCAAN